MKLPRALLLCSFALAALAGCGGDYEANPLVCNDDNDDTVVYDENNPTFSRDCDAIIPAGGVDTTLAASSAYLDAQLGALQGRWLTQCVDQQQSEIEYSGSIRTVTTNYYTDDTCLTASTTPSTVVTDSYIDNGYTTDSSGRDVVRLNYTNTADSTLSYDIVWVNGNQLYTSSIVAATSYPTALDYNTYAIRN